MEEKHTIYILITISALCCLLIGGLIGISISDKNVTDKNMIVNRLILSDNLGSFDSISGSSLLSNFNASGKCSDGILYFEQNNTAHWFCVAPKTNWKYINETIYGKTDLYTEFHNKNDVNCLVNGSKYSNNATICAEYYLLNYLNSERGYWIMIGYLNNNSLIEYYNGDDCDASFGNTSCSA